MMEGNLGAFSPTLWLAANRVAVLIQRRQVEQARSTADLDMAERIKSAVAERFHLAVRDLEGAQKLLRIAMARQVAMYLIRQTTRLSYPTIGDLFNRDHSTVIHACGVIAARVAQPQFAKLVDELKEECA